MSCQNIFVFTFLQCHGKVAFFETKMRVFIESKVKSCKTEGWRPSVQWSLYILYRQKIVGRTYLKGLFDFVAGLIHLVGNSFQKAGHDTHFVSLI